jgi:shikimate kinase
MAPTPTTRPDLEGLGAIVLLGPIGAGKSTVGRLLASALGCGFHSLDERELEFSVPAGFDREHMEELFRTEGIHAEYRYRRGFFADVVTGFLATRPAGVVELGGGHPVVPEAADQRRVEETLAPYPRVVALLPVSDREAARAVLRARMGPEAAAADLNRYALADDTLVRLAKVTVVTGEQSPEETAREVLERLGLAG